jgi:predicted ATPase
MFRNANEAANAARSLQRALGAEAWPRGARVAVRIGVHMGDVIAVGDELVGLAVHQAARIGDTGHGGQVILSPEAAADVGAGLERLGPFRVRDFDEPVELWRLRSEGWTDPGLPPRVPPAGQEQLPAYRTQFMGRDDDIARIADLVVHHGVVTLVGPGGVGKTRLAVEVARHVAPHVGYRVAFADLASVTEPAAVIDTIARALGVQEGSASPAEDLRQAAARWRGLVLVDNCEHVIEAAADAVDVLWTVGDDLAVIATSREALQLPGETTWRVSPLDGQVAVDLLIDRVRSRDAQWTWGTAETESAVALVRSLDGLPLAIELVAGRVAQTGLTGSSSVAEATRGLSGLRGLPDRHLTLAATLDWSYRLLDEDERTMLRRISVCYGGMTEELAGAVCESPIASDVLVRLAEKSLIALTPGRQLRYRLYETVGVYARERLDESGEASAVELRHARTMLRLLERHARGDPEDLDRLAEDHANLRVALERTLERGLDPRLGRQLAAGLVGFWSTRGMWREANGWLDLALAAPDHDEAWVRCALGRMVLAEYAGDRETARRVFQAAADAVPADAPPALRAAASRAAGSLAQADNDHAAATSHYERALSFARDANDRLLEAEVLTAMVAVAFIQGEFADAVRVGESALEVVRATGATAKLGKLLSNVAAAANEIGDLEHARVLLLESLRLRRELHDLRGEAAVLVNLADNERRAGDPQSAAGSARAAYAIAAELGDEQVLPFAAGNLGYALLDAGYPVEALRILRALDARAERLTRLAAVEFTEAAKRAEQILGDDAKAVVAEGTAWGLARSVQASNETLMTHVHAG